MIPAEKEIERLWLVVHSLQRQIDGLTQRAFPPAPKPPVEREGNVIRFPGGSHG